MKYLLPIFLLLGFSSTGWAAEWCPKYEGQFPAAVVDLGKYKIFYFVAGSIYSEAGQAAMVYLVRGQEVFARTTAEGFSDWFTSTEYQGERNGFSCDSVTLDFESAWLIDESREFRHFDQGEVRAREHKSHPLVCAGEL